MKRLISVFVVSAFWVMLAGCGGKIDAAALKEAGYVLQAGKKSP
jgi:hypothetical protein